MKSTNKKSRDQAQGAFAGQGKTHVADLVLALDKAGFKGLWDVEFFPTTGNPHAHSPILSGPFLRETSCGAQRNFSRNVDSASSNDL
jgi:hypothetical protein